MREGCANVGQKTDAKLQKIVLCEKEDCRRRGLFVVRGGGEW